MFHAGRLPTKKRHNAETNSPVQPMGTYRRRVFLESIYGKSFSCRNGRKSSYSRASAVSAMGKHERRWNISPDGTITRSNVTLTAKRLSSAENRGPIPESPVNSIFRRHTPIIFVATKEIEVFQKSVEVSADSWT